MRPDVKLGVAISTVLVLVAGGYFMYRGGQHEPIPVGSEEVPKARSDDGVKDTVARRTDNQPARPRAHEATRPARTPARREVAGRRPGAAPVRRATQPREGQPASNHAGDVTQPRSTEPGDVGVTKEAGAGSPPDVPDQGDLPASNSQVAQRPEAERKGTTTSSLTDSPSSPEKGRGPGSLLAASAPAQAPTTGAVASEKGVAVESHRVQSGDTMSALAKRYYGSSRYTQFLIQNNPQIADPNWLRVGMTVRIPPKPEEDAKAASLSREVKAGDVPPRSYRVEPGDTFYGIARDVLGDSSRWKELFELNKQAVHGDPTNLRVGQVITLPPS